MFNWKTWFSVMAAASIIATSGAAPGRAATILTFEQDQGLADPGNSGTAIPNSYGGLDWTGFNYVNGVTFVGNPSGYYNGVVSSTNVAYNTDGHVASLSLAGPGVFTFNSAYLTGAWNDGLSVTVDGYVGGLGGTHLYTQTVVVNTSGPTHSNFNFQNIDTLKFTSSGGTPHQGYLGAGTHFVMDDFSFTLGEVGAVPEPASLISAAVAVAAGLGLGASRRRRAA